MSGETQSSVSGWTVDTLKEHFDDKIADLDRRITNDVTHAKEMAAQSDTNSQTAINKAEAATANRFSGFNEFNDRIDKIVAATLPRESFEQFQKQYGADKQQTEERFNRMFGERSGATETRQTATARMTLVIAVASVIAGLVATLIGSLFNKAPAATTPQVIYVPSPPGTMLPTTPPQPAPR